MPALSVEAQLRVVSRRVILTKKQAKQQIDNDQLLMQTKEILFE